MSLRHVPAEHLVPGVTRLRHAELGTEMIFMELREGYVLTRDADGVDRQAYPCHIDDADLVE